MSDGTPALRTVFLFAALACAGCATTPEASPAKAYLDRAQPLHCEVAALEDRLDRAPAGSEEAAALSEELVEARARVKAYYQATWPEYMALLMELPLEERRKLYAYSDDVVKRCASAFKAKERRE